MVKSFSAVILLCLLMPVNPSFAQSSSGGGVKVYSGYLHQYRIESENSFWQSLFSPHFPKQDNIIEGSECSIEFKSPIAFSRQPVTEVPKELSYLVSFKNGAETPTGINPFKKFIINIYTNDEQMYSIDPEAEGRQIGLNEEHHIVDSYLIYLILEKNNIDHLEIVSASPAVKDKYILDKFEIHDN